jgi:glycosyltransferase involved in cell wall biosynthesis
MKPIIIIPAFNPDEKLIPIVEKLYDMGLRTVIVDDGSRKDCTDIFDKLEIRYGCDVCHHKRNMGKGAALKTGIRYAALNYPEASGYVTADADGQHSAEDILKTAIALENNPDSLILGTRDFRKNGIPFKSRWGNRITSLIYFFSTGRRCSDTQTGLRGIPKKYRTHCLSVPGERYEYEMNLLMEMGKKKIPFETVSIDTIYLEGNTSSHFNPFRDSAVIYFNIFKYSLSSLVSAAADLSLFTLFVHSVFGAGTEGILAATVSARLTSGCMNFALNKFWVFESKRRSVYEAFLYAVLFCGQMTLSWLLVASLKQLPLNLTLIKVFVDTGLFFISYAVQKNLIFNKTEERKAISQ